jgi:hypothetical protein
MKQKVVARRRQICVTLGESAAKYPAIEAADHRGFLKARLSHSLSA